jgi:quercetin dioxygenase-like cupin family protein
MSKDLAAIPGREGLMITVTYPPGSSDPIHRHNAHGFIYVLEGSIVMKVRGGKEITLTPGQSFYEGPHDVHVIGRNASRTRPAKFVVFLIKEQRRWERHGRTWFIPLKVETSPARRRYGTRILAQAVRKEKELLGRRKNGSTLH